MIRFRLANNGKMIAPSRLEQMRETLEHPELSSSGRVGIANLAQRLKLKYPNRHSIQVSSEPGETVFVIEIPADPILRKKE